MFLVIISLVCYILLRMDLGELLSQLTFIILIIVHTEDTTLAWRLHVVVILAISLRRLVNMRSVETLLYHLLGSESVLFLIISLRRCALSVLIVRIHYPRLKGCFWVIVNIDVVIKFFIGTIGFILIFDSHFSRTEK